MKFLQFQNYFSNLISWIIVILNEVIHKYLMTETFLGKLKYWNINYQI